MVTAANALVRLLRLEQITSGVVMNDSGEARVVDESKRQALESLLEDLPAEEPVVVFAVFKSDLASVHLAAAATGRTSGELSGDRDDLAAWQCGNPHPTILAVQIQAGGVGIDLTRAHYAVYFSTGFNLGNYLQSRARLYRAGQTRPVMFYHLIATDTVDELVEEALAHRQDLVTSVLKELACSHSNQPTTPALRPT
jgi:SNF2 family DNA or RNA helicase